MAHDVSPRGDSARSRQGIAQLLLQRKTQALMERTRLREHDRRYNIPGRRSTQRTHEYCSAGLHFRRMPCAVLD